MVCSGVKTSSVTRNESVNVTSPLELMVPAAVPGATSENVTCVDPTAFVETYGWIDSDASLMVPVSGATWPAMVTGSGSVAAGSCPFTS